MNRSIAQNSPWRAVLVFAGILLALPVRAEPELAIREIAPGVHVHLGAQQDPSPDNLGDIANIGFVVGSRCVAVIDTGGSIAVGRALRRAVERTTKLPVCYVVNTHMHPDHVFGNAAFPDAEFVGHARLPAALAVRGQNYLRALARDVGSATAGTEIVLPRRTVADAAELDLGGRVLELRAWRTAHTDNDLTVFDRRTGTLWLSDLLFVERIPALDGNLRGWLAVLAELRRATPKHVIPGHGPLDGAWPALLDPEVRYLDTLLRETRAAIKKKATIQQAVETVGAEERSRWLLFDSFHRRNVTAAYAELEWED